MSARTTLAVLLLLFLAARGAAVAALGDVFFYGEEREKGAVGELLRAWIAGELRLPWTALPYHPYEGGGFFASHLKAAMFALVGPSMLAHKLCALASGALVLAALYVFVLKHFGARAAAWAGLFFVFGPKHFQSESLLHLGIHFEALFFLFFVLDRALRVAGAPCDGPARTRDLAALGLASGFGLWFSYQLLPVLALAFVLVAAARPWSRLPRELSLASAAFALGATPLWIMAGAAGRGVLDLHGSEIGGAGGFARLASFARSCASQADWPGRVQGAAWLALACFGLASALRARKRRVAAATLAAYAALFALGAGWSGLVAPECSHWFQLLRFAPPVAVALALAAVGAGAGAASARAPVRRAAAALALVAVACGAWQSARLVLEGEPRTPVANLARLARASGVDWHQGLAKVVPRRSRESLERAAPFLALAGEGARDRYRFAFAAAVDSERALRPGASFDGLLAELVALAPDGARHREALALGLGRTLDAEARGERRGALESLAALAPEEAELRAEALGRFGTGWVVFPRFYAGELALARGAPGAAGFRRGLGWRVFQSFVAANYGRLDGQDLALRPAAAREWLAESTPPDELPDVLRGFDEAARDARLAAE